MLKIYPWRVSQLKINVCFLKPLMCVTLTSSSGRVYIVVTSVVNERVNVRPTGRCVRVCMYVCYIYVHTHHLGVYDDIDDAQLWKEYVNVCR